MMRIVLKRALLVGLSAFAVVAGCMGQSDPGSGHRSGHPDSSGVDEGAPTPDQGERSSDIGEAQEAITVSCHDVCTTGNPQARTCSVCANKVCFEDPFCCTGAWDSICVFEAETDCVQACGCAHSVCTTGSKLTTTCNTCAARVCTIDPFCCSNTWDSLCVKEARFYCGAACDP